jgi:hypothetical protein
MKAALLADFRHRGAEPPRGSRIDLSRVTLCAIDCVEPELAARSLYKSMAQCRFGAVKLLTSRPACFEGITRIEIPPIDSVSAYSEFVMKRLAPYVDTDYVLVTQWDSYVLDAAMWSDDYYEYDYIGAPWDLASNPGFVPEDVVGNGGFSLRSQRVLQAGTDPRFSVTHPEDFQLCRRYRREMQHDHGVRFAPPAIAARFSSEHTGWDLDTFGFHGVPYICRFENNPRWLRFEFEDEAH